MQWYELYRKLAKSLNELYLKYGDLAGEKLYLSYIKRDPNLEILSWVRNFKVHSVTSLDPLHVFASFNYYKISAEIRKKRIILFCDLLKDNNIPTGRLTNDIYRIENIDVFKDFPHINITHSVSSREFKEQRDIWKLFSLTHENEKEKIGEYFNRYANWHGVDIPSMTIFMFWVNSDNFLPLDKNTEVLLKKNKVIEFFPKNYEQYLKIINKNNTNIYRTLAKVAIDENTRYELSDNEKQELDIFLNRDLLYVSSQIEDKDIEDKLNIEFIPNFDFEIYVMTNGIIQKIVCINDKIAMFESLTTIVKNVKNDKHNFTYPDFQLIAIKILKSDYLNGLQKNKLYYFTNNFEIKNNEVLLKNTDTLKLYSDYNINNINITAIVGKNGTGKSTIAELLVMAVNNFSYILQNDLDYELGELKNLFYTIYTNYSLHALNERHYEGNWLNKLFHKNDGYQTPVVIEPYREEGIIDINVLESLTKQRLLSTILRKSIDNKDFTTLTEGRIATHLNISIDIEKLNSIMHKIAKKNANTQKIQSINQVLNNPENMRIIRFLVPQVSSSIKVKTNSRAQYIGVYNEKNLPLIVDIAKLYICYKVSNINKTYHESTQINEQYLRKLIEDKSHITFKLHQAINYLKFKIIREGKTSIKELSNFINTIKDENNIQSIMEVLPPSFFKVDIVINNETPFSKLSSGEKQEIYATSSIVYHLQNIESVHNGDSNRINYKYVNIILDEIELYFHPDMQRKFIYNLLQAIENKGGFNHITGLNIMMITHSPFILSDILKENILYLSHNEKTSETEVLGDTFAANIHTLLDNSFFMDNGLMGKFAKKKINGIIEELNELYEKSKDVKSKNIEIFEEVSRTRREEMSRIIENIGEPFLKKKLSDMYIKVFEPQKTPLEILEDERKNLDRRIARLKNDSD